MASRRSFHDELDALKGEVAFMGTLVSGQLTAVLEALAEGSEDKALAVEEGDDPVDQKYVEIEHRILGLLARQAPVARDLRFVSGVLHINIHLERMSDLCVNISKFVALTRDFSVIPTVRDNIQEMGQMAGHMIEQAIESFETLDVDLALTLPRLDAPIDKLNKQMFREIGKHASDELTLEYASRMAMVARYIERIADHAVDIGEQVAFIMTGEIQEFDD